MKLVMPTPTLVYCCTLNAGIQWAHISHSDLSFEPRLDSRLRGNDNVWQGQSTTC